MSARLPVRKTYKLFIGGAFVRSESGGTTALSERRHEGGAAGFNIPRGSRKDVRDAVAAARKALPGWAGRTAYNRGQILYRFAEALESRAADIGAERSDVEASIDVLVHYAGWTDKLAAGAGRDQPGGGAVPVVLGAGADRRRGSRGARRAAAARADRRAGAGARGGQHRRRGALRRTAAPRVGPR